MARTVYLGTSDFAATVLERLADSAHRPQLVVTRPDRPAGRGRRLSAPPVADAARALGLELRQPENVNEPDAYEQIAAAAPDAVIVCAFGALIREPLLSDFDMLNVHPSLLPRWRGAAPVERAMMAGDSETGVCIIGVRAGLDSGPIFLAGREPIAPDDTYGTLAPRHDVTCVLTRPDAPAGRGRKLLPSPAKLAAERLRIPVLQPERLEPGLDLGAPVVVAVAYGLIVPERLLEERLWLNVHPSLLPRWRGAAPVERALMAGDAETGVTIIQLVKGLDAGPIAAQESFAIGADDEAGAVFAKAA